MEAERVASWGLAGADQPKGQRLGWSKCWRWMLSACRGINTLFPIMSSPVVVCSTPVARSNSWRPSYSKHWSSKLRDFFFSPVVPNILLSFHFTASLQLLKCNSRKTAVKRKVFQSQHLINKETGNFLLQIQKRGLVLEKQRDIFTVLRRTVLSDCECTPCSEY